MDFAQRELSEFVGYGKSSVANNATSNTANNVASNVASAEKLRAFKDSLCAMLESASKDSSEEFQKNLIAQFLRKSFGYECNVRGKADLAIYDEGKAKVLFEVKSTANKAEFVKSTHPRDFILDCHESRCDSRNDKKISDSRGSILDEKSGLCSHERGNKTKASIDEASGKLPDLSRKAEFTLAPEAILGYIYAVLYHKDYREKYIDFLKIDFPKIPFVESKETFLALSALGRDLIDLHLMRVDLSGESVGEALFSDLSNKNEKIEKIAYNAESKGLFVNSSLYFDNVSAEVWEYKIGGYAVLDKYLKSHKGESIDYDHFECIIKTLHKSLEIQSKIAQISLASNNTFSYPL